MQGEIGKKTNIRVKRLYIWTCAAFNLIAFNGPMRVYKCEYIKQHNEDVHTHEKCDTLGCQLFRNRIISNIF